MEIFSSDAVFIRRINLPNYLQVENVILKRDGQLVIVHNLQNNGYLFWFISLVTNKGQIIDYVTVTSEGYFSTETMSCWLLDLTVTRVNDSDLKSSFECFTAKPYSYLMLEEIVFSISPLLEPRWKYEKLNNYSVGRTRSILQDIRLKIQCSIAIHKFA